MRTGTGSPGLTARIRRAAGRHAAGRPADDAVAEPRDDLSESLGSSADRDGAGDRPGSLPGDLATGVRADGDPDPAPAARRAGGSDSAVRLVWVYPDLLSTYGDRGNLLVLSRRARLRGIEVEAIEVNSDQPVPQQGDIYLLGGGEDLPQILAANRLRADGGLAAAASHGSVVFAVCAGYQLLGRQVRRRGGRARGRPRRSSTSPAAAAIGAASASSSPTSIRRSACRDFTGFENHQGVTKLGSGARPLARVTMGVGNGDGTEGAYAGKVLGTYMHGPALARNPGLADLLLSWAVGRLAPLDPDAEEWASQLRAERLAAVSS